MNTATFIEEVKKFATELSLGVSMAFSFTKMLLKESYTNNLESHLDREAELIVKTAAAKDFQEGLSAFFEKRKPNFTDN